MADAVFVMLLGMCCRGHLSQGRALMAPYLPRNGASGSPYSEGGALYALGLIHANHGQDIRDFLLESLRGTQNEVIACETHVQGLYVAGSLSHATGKCENSLCCASFTTLHNRLICRLII